MVVEEDAHRSGFHRQQCLPPSPCRILLTIQPQISMLTYLQDWRSSCSSHNLASLAMPSARYIITLLVAAHIVAASVDDLAGRVRRGLIDPLWRLIAGRDDVGLLIGPFDVGTIIGGLVSCILSIFLSLLLLRLVFRLCWRWIERLVPNSSGSPSSSTPIPPAP